MTSPSGLHILHDTGPPEGNATSASGYTTLVLIHGYAWHSGIFKKLLPLAPAHNARLVLVNRRDYPGAAAYTAEERALLNGESLPPAAEHEQLLTYTRARAREVYDLLAQLVTTHNIPPAQPEANAGGIVLVGWSFGTTLMTSLLANVASFRAGDVDLGRYVRRIVFHDSPYLALGFPPMADPYNPLADSTLAPDTRTRVFANWVSGYYAHGETMTPDVLERRTPLASPPPTLSTLTDADRADALYPPPGDPGGSDALLLAGGMRSGLFAALLERAIVAPTSNKDGDKGEGEGDISDGWPQVEVRYVWCDRSVWEIPWGVHSLRAKLESEREAGNALRDVTLLRVRGANHFVHWDEPERAIAAFLASRAEADK